ncbi:MAG: hypothetical protein AAGB30_10975 [Pedobacter sp.]
MSMTSYGAINALFDHLKTSVVFTSPVKVRGKLYRMQRPLNSLAEDVVINSLALSYDPVQKGYLNVNFYVQNPRLKIGNIHDSSQPDSARIDEISGLGKAALGDGEEIWSDDGTFCFRIEQDTVIADTNNQHYLNFRVEFYSLNIN